MKQWWTQIHRTLPAQVRGPKKKKYDSYHQVPIIIITINIKLTHSKTILEITVEIIIIIIIFIIIIIIIQCNQKKERKWETLQSWVRPTVQAHSINDIFRFQFIQSFPLLLNALKTLKRCISKPHQGVLVLFKQHRHPKNTPN